MHLNTRGTYKRDLSKVFTYNCMCEEPQLSGVMVGRRKKERTNCVNADSHCAILTLPETASALAKAWRGWEAQKPRSGVQTLTQTQSLYFGPAGVSLITWVLLNTTVDQASVLWASQGWSRYKGHLY